MSVSPINRHPPIRLGPGQQRWFYSSVVVLWASGTLWLAFHYFLSTAGAFGPEPHPLEPWWLRLHGLAVMIGLVTLGSVAIHHAGRAWQLRKNRLMGAGLTIAFAWLAVSGYALYYFSTDANQAWLPLLHWIPGLALPAVLGWHIRAGRARQRPRRAPTLHQREHPGADHPHRPRHAAPDDIASTSTVTRH